MSARKRRLKIPDRAEWILFRKPGIKVERVSKPNILSLEEAVNWIKKERPIIWSGSIFSCPDPSCFPSGLSITNSLLSLILRDSFPPEHLDRIVQALSYHWPLEALLDEFERVEFDLSESLLEFFEKHNKSAEPNLLHTAIVTYYQKGFAQKPLCITTNWDTLLEKAFRKDGFKAIAGGPGKMPPASFGKVNGNDRTIFIYHPHGSFHLRDVVCSYHREQRQLVISPDLFSQPTLFLGYSGYEPSLYFNLENQSAQLWCVRNIDDFEIPAKRRLLSRPNTFVYLGDLRDLLKALSLLDNHQFELQVTDLFNTGEGIPAKVLEVVRSRILSSVEPGICSSLLTQSLFANYGETESRVRYCTLMRSMIDHLRNRVDSPTIIQGLLSSAHFRNSEQLWISVLAYLLRHETDVPKNIVDLIMSRAQSAPSSGLWKEESPEDLFVYGHGSCKQRRNIYEKHIGLRTTIADAEEGKANEDLLSDETLSIVTGLYSADLGALGEYVEMLAFDQVRKEDFESASAFFDYAASCFYLRGLWNAGRINEWAASNTETLREIAKKNTLRIPARFE
jgi:SIR2-like domain